MTKRKKESPIEEAQRFQKTMADENKSQNELARELGVSQPTVSQKLSLLDLLPELQLVVAERKMRLPDAYHIAAYPQAEQKAALKKLKEKELATCPKCGTRFEP